ncbi:NAD(P)H-hydrate dehydratase [uncultured Shewanella sp.]|uniref:NAD(P)H-hydrate dehydratase n=1 Tax=uncultured Shewanella sp. TaxID=173975 RepID=UPI00262A944C|nr:NAD(P)H-hydrate dehydratase [uncultured Shewanella sp.]
MFDKAFSVISLYRSRQVKEAELQKVKTGDCSLFNLVELAASAAFELLTKLEKTSQPIWLLAGNGNNGSDAYVLASLLLKAGVTANVMSQHKAELHSELKQAQKIYIDQGGTIQPFCESTILSSAVIIDGLLGTGLRKEKLTEDMDRLISVINESEAWVLSLDVPSGINADTGFAYSTAVMADVTLTFGGTKQGLYTSRARHFSGQIHHAFVGLKGHLPSTKTWAIAECDVSKILPARVKDAHKGDNGKVTVIGGDEGMLGAVMMASEACLRGGAGLVSVISKPEHLLAVNVIRPEVMFCACEKLTNKVSRRIDWANIIVIGPGLGRELWGKVLLDAVKLSLKHTPKPCVIDADALYLLKGQSWHYRQWVLTPHTGEAARLLDISRAEVEQDRFSAIKQLHQIYGGVIVLKGAGTLIYDGKHMIVAPVGNPGLASGGSGDVLSGIIGALLGQGLNTLNAAVLGVVIHGKAADLAAINGEIGMLASDLMPFIRQLLNENIVKI